MRNMLQRLTVIPLSASVVVAILAAYMFYLGTPPVSADYGTYNRWVADHQEQFLAEQNGRFYWAEIHSGLLLGGFAAFLFAVGMYSLQLLIVVKISRVTAKAVQVEARDGEAR